ncbi:RNA methyltransferase [Mesorhizobium sp. RP14(2022)]|uniref:RNA methyltransferase n=1 Tax=Mesorhizobium liriopis TaxID=2953882 RepID=A0ABT1C1S7_9HYPH|nr:RNA methyltransferase [Mesorhizobium liriopis]MCO6048777.1 RNA methyltransferase [Mesorhizobium liriopis]
MTPTLTISDPSDPRIAAYRDIRERDLVGRENRFIAEGKVVIDVLLSARRFEAESVLLLPSRLSGMEAVLAKLPGHVPVYCAEPAVMDAIAGFHLHRGILAIGRKRPAEKVGDVLAGLPEEALVVVAAGIANHDNMGAIFRNAAAFGACAVLLDPISCDPLYRKAIRVSVGAVLKVPFATAPDAGMLVEALDDAGFAQAALSPGGKLALSAVPRGQRRALWLGAEGTGLPEDLLSRIPSVRIPQAPQWDSLNVAAASAVALYHFSGAGEAV